MFWFHVYLTENSANIPWPCLLQEETLKFRRFAAKVCGWSRHYIFSKFEGPAFKDSWSSCTICLLSVPAPRIFWHALPPPFTMFKHRRGVWSRNIQNLFQHSWMVSSKPCPACLTGSMTVSAIHVCICTWNYNQNCPSANSVLFNVVC